MRAFECQLCRGTVFFDNHQCMRSGAWLGYAPQRGTMLAWAQGGDPSLPACANRQTAAACNWMRDGMRDDDVHPSLCCSCRLTQVLPPLHNAANGARWRSIEQAKRRLVFNLIALGLTPEPKRSPDDAMGLAFHLLEDQPGAQPVKTGHALGTITLNVAEADDDRREALRVQLGEPMRTLLGHLRHEAAHYLHYRWIDGTPAAVACRDAFGDETADYVLALAQHYQNGPPADWSEHFVSAYASAHPWEDWAETCAHYLLVLDAVHTAGSWGLQLSGVADTAAQALDMGAAPTITHLVLQQWLPLAQFLNAMNRSLGQRDSYPFLLPPTVLHKMTVVQQLLQQAASSR